MYFKAIDQFYHMRKNIFAIPICQCGILSLPPNLWAVLFYRVESGPVDSVDRVEPIDTVKRRPKIKVMHNTYTQQKNEILPARRELLS